MFPAWHAAWTAAEIQEQLPNFKFLGPGVYYDKDETTLVTRQDDATEMEPYDDPKLVYDVHVFNANKADTIFGLIDVLKVRKHATD